MTQRQKPEKEFLQESFLPQIAVCCSYDAEVICRKNNLTFIELIQPFSKYNGEIKIFDPSNNPSNIKNFKIDIKDINHIDPQPIAIKKILESCMLYNVEEDTLSLSSFENHLYKITANTCTPWFEKWRENFIKYCIKEDHEFIRNYLGCIFVVSTSHIDPLDQFQKLVIQEQTDSTQNNCKKWFFPNFANVYKYFVLLHDVQEGEISKAHLIYESLKNSYGSSNCHLLQINSKSFENHDFDKTYPDFDPWSKYCKLRDIYKNFDSPNDSILENVEHYQERHGMCLSLSDHDRIKTFFSEFLTRGLIPYAEKTIRVLNEQFQSKKNILKGFSISKKFFGLSNSSVKTSTSPIISLSNLTMNPQDTSNSSSKATGTFFNSNNQFVHTNDDLNTRRLADLTFLFQFYELSLYFYLSFKKDFASIQNSAFAGSENSFYAKLHLASVLEMASIAGYLNSVTDQVSQSNLSSFTQNKNLNTQHIEEALQIYTNECKNDSYSTRCLLFSTEIFRMISNHSKAASQLINFYVDENDLRRSLFLEQAAYYYLVQYPSNFRKFSFLITLAGENFKKIGQDMHSVLAYKSALQVYSNKAWTRILDQINFSLSCQSQKLSNIDQALQYLGDILFKKKSINMLTCAAISRENKLSTRHNSSNESYILQQFINFSNSLNLNASVDLILRLPPTIDIATLRINLNPIENFCLDSNNICINDQESLDFFKNSSYSLNDSKEIWKKLEEAVCISNFGTIPSVFFKAQSSIYNSSVIYNSIPTAVCNEFIEISFNLVNTLKVDLILKDCVLIWKFNNQNINEKDKNSQISSDQENNQILDCAETKSIDQILIPCKSEKLIRLLIKAREQTGNLCILGIKYKLATDTGSIKLCEHLEGKQLFEFKEKRNNNIKKNMRPKAISVQNSLNFKIVKKMPLLQVNADNLPQKMFCNQIHKINICLMNLSEDSSIGNIKIAIDKSSKSNVLFKKSNLQSSNDFDFKFENVDTEIVQNLSSIIIKPKQEAMLDLWIQTNDISEINFFNFLIAYQEINGESIASLPASKPNRLEYRTIRFRLVIENASMICENKIRMMNPLRGSSFIGNIEINCRSLLDEMSICNIFSISKFWKILSFKKNYPTKLNNVELSVSEKSKKLSFVFKAETVNSNTTENKKFESLHLNLFNNDTSSHHILNNVNSIIENFCENRYKYICENNCLVLYFLIMIRKKEEKFFILKDVEFSSKIINKPLIPNQDFNKRIHMNATQHEKIISYCSKVTRNGSSKYERPFILSS